MSVHDMLAQAREMPYGAAQIALLEQAIAHADAQRLPDAAFEARMLATTGYIYGGEPARSFVTFSWCLTEFDQDPVRYGQWTHHLLWSFKSIIGAMTKFPEIPLARTADVLDDMERRWRAGGHSPHAVYAHRHLVARHVGDLDGAEEWFGRWSAAPRDDLSDCIGCDPTSKAYWLADRGRDEEAIALAEPVLAGRLSCTEQPQAIHTALLVPYLRTGRLDAARDAHRRAYRAHRTHLADLADISEHVVFCALTGNDALGLEIVERHLDWLDRSPTPWATMTFTASAALILRRLAQSGHSGLSVAGRPVGDLAEELAGQALDLAARFDNRNGTNYQSQKVRETLAAEPIGGVLPLAAPGSRSAPAVASASGGPPGQAAAPASEQAAASASGGAAGQVAASASGQAAGRAVASASGGPPGQAAASASEQAAASASGGAAGQVAASASGQAAGRAAASASGGAAGQAAASASGGAAGQAASASGQAAGQAAAPASGQAAVPGQEPAAGQAAGDRQPARPLRTAAAPPPVPATTGPDELLDLAETAFRAGREDDAFAAWAAFDDRYATGPLTDLQRARRTDGAGNRAARDREDDAAVATWRQADALYAAAGDEQRRQVVRGRIGMGLLRQGHAQQGGALIEESTAHLIAHGATEQLARAHLRLAYAQATAGRIAEAVATSRTAERHAGAAQDPTVLGQILGLRAQALGRLGEIEEAEAAAAQSRQQHRETGPPDELANACWLHGVTLRQLGRADEALAAFDEALRLPAAAGLHRLATRQRAGLLALSERAAEAIAPLVEEIATLTAEGDRDTVAYARHELAAAYLNAGRPLDAAEVGEEALAAFEAAADDHALLTRELLVAVYRELSEHESVVDQLTALVTALAARGDQEALARATEQLAEAADRLDRDATAAARFAEAAAAYAIAGAPIDAARARRRHVTSLLWAGHADEALAALADADTAVAGLPDQPHAVWERAMLDYDAARLLARADRRGGEAVARAGRAAAGFHGLGAAVQAGYSGLLHGELLRAAGRHDEARAALDTALARAPKDEEGLREQLEAALSAVRDDRF